MKCPKCKAGTHCYDSRPTRVYTRRRYQCLSCKGRFTTYEFRVADCTISTTEIKLNNRWLGIHPQRKGRKIEVTA